MMTVGAATMFLGGLIACVTVFILVAAAIILPILHYELHLF